MHCSKSTKVNTARQTNKARMQRKANFVFILFFCDLIIKHSRCHKKEFLLVPSSSGSLFFSRVLLYLSTQWIHIVVILLLNWFVYVVILNSSYLEIKLLLWIFVKRFHAHFSILMCFVCLKVKQKIKMKKKTKQANEQK